MGSIEGEEGGEEEWGQKREGSNLYNAVRGGAENKNRIGLALLRQSLGMAVMHQDISAFAKPSRFLIGIAHSQPPSHTLSPNTC